eukprot:g15965.t1
MTMSLVLSLLTKESISQGFGMGKERSLEDFLRHWIDFDPVPNREAKVGDEAKDHSQKNWVRGGSPRSMSLSKHKNINGREGGGGAGVDEVVPLYPGHDDTCPDGGRGGWFSRITGAGTGAGTAKEEIEFPARVRRVVELDDPRTRPAPLPAAPAAARGSDKIKINKVSSVSGKKKTSPSPPSDDESEKQKMEETPKKSELKAEKKPVVPHKQKADERERKTPGLPKMTKMLPPTSTSTSAARPEAGTYSWLSAVFSLCAFVLLGFIIFCFRGGKLAALFQKFFGNFAGGGRSRNSSNNGPRSANLYNPTPLMKKNFDQSQDPLMKKNFETT